MIEAAPAKSRIIPTPCKDPGCREALTPGLGLLQAVLVEGAAKGNSSHPGSRAARDEASVGSGPRAHTSPARLFLEGRAVVGEPLLTQRTDAGYFKPYC